MDKWLATIGDINIMYWIAGLFALLELFRWVWTFIEWVISKFGIETKNMRTQRENRERLTNAENDIKGIKETAEKNVETFLEHERIMNDNFISIKEEIIQEIGKLHDKIDEQSEHLEVIDSEGKKRDCSLFRDRLIQGLRYFSQNKDENGVVHISMTDFENLNTMFGEYFSAGGNGSIKHIYNSEFQKFRIDNESFDLR